MMTTHVDGAWHDQDGFWDTLGPVIFDEERRDLARPEVEQLVGLLEAEMPCRICDLCCGIGRHSIELARRGFQVVGVDRTQRYLDSARCEAQAAGVTVEFVQDDMRSFCRPEAFDLVLNMFTSFGYFERRDDDGRVVENAFRSLRPGGRLVVDTVGKEIMARVFRQREWRPVNGGMLLEERKIIDDWSRIESRWILIKDGVQRECRFVHWLYSAFELRELFAACGFRDIRVCGALDGRLYDDEAQRLVVIGRK